jgi:hypothetical protein
VLVGLRHPELITFNCLPVSFCLVVARCCIQGLLGDAMCDFLEEAAPKDLLAFAEEFLLMFADAEKKTKLDQVEDFVIEAIDHVLCLCRCVVAVVCPKPLHLKSSQDDVKFFFGESTGWESGAMLSDALTGVKVSLTKNDQFMAHIGVYWGFASVESDNWPEFLNMRRP